jgi:colanic acid/amylovoran biosynthesis protein
MWQDMLRPLHKRGCKIVFLPQAFGPVEKPNTKKILELLNGNADLIMPRERISLSYLQKSSVIDMNKVKMFTDFTSLVEGAFPEGYEHLRNGICIIPNLRMIDKGIISYDAYIRLLTDIVSEGKKSGHPVYLLNHEGLKDEKLCFECQKSFGDDIEVVTNLNALEVKGLIASAYLVITSRFHGLASALNSCVPSLATSWSHKYEELCKDYKLKDCVLPLNDLSKSLEKVALMLEDSKNNEIRNHLSLQVPKIKSQTIEMWNSIWSL